MKLFDLIKKFLHLSKESTHKPPIGQKKYRRKPIKSPANKTSAFDAHEVHEPPKVQEKYKNESVQPLKITNSSTKARHHAERKNVGTPKRNKTKKAIVGIDFGTSFTKVFCSVSDYGRFALQFETDDPERYFLPSVLFYSAKENSLSLKKDDGLEKIEYFKYGLINNDFLTIGKIHENNPKTKNSISLICSTFFIANVIRLVKDAVCRKCRTDDVVFFFNMGCPIDNFNDGHKGIYDRALNIGFALSKVSGFESFSVNEIDTFINDKRNFSDASLNTLPELYAEALWFIEKHSTDEGIYTILDVGGGTVDCATIAIKREDGERKTRIYSQTVMPLGVEVLLKDFYPMEYRSERPVCVGKLKEMNVKLPKHGQGYPPLTKIEHKKSLEFRSGFVSGVVAADNTDKKLMAEQRKKIKRIPYYAFGGGADFNFYHSTIKYANEDLQGLTQGTNIPSLRREPVENDIKEIPSNRFIIAERLSHPYFYEIDGFPWDFPNNIRNTDGSFDLASYGLLDT